MNYFVLSLAVHLIFLTALHNYEKPITFHPPPLVVALNDKPPKPKRTKGKGQAIVQKSNKGTKDCQNSYGGIGVYHTIDDIITDVIPGYPAWELGLRPGDRIIESERIDGTPGTMVTFQVVRDGIISSHMVKRARICLDR